jgi:hypothetical protein
MSDDDPPTNAAVDPVRAADRILDLVTTDSVHGGLAARALQRALRWTLERAAVGAPEAARQEAWATRASDVRLQAASLRHVAWTIVLEPDEASGRVERAAALIVAAMRFRAELADPACPQRMREHCERLFGTTLVPGRERFEVHRGRGRHVIVGVDGALRAVEVLEASGAVRDEAAIREDLQACVDAPPTDAPTVLSLTAAPRASAWTTWREVARSSPEAATLLREALLSVFFDGAAPADADARGRLAQGGPAASRCFWHALQLIVFRDGNAALVGSFVAGVEGEGAMEVGERLGRARPAAKDATGAQATARPTPEPLTWTLGERATGALAAAARHAPIDAGGLLRVAGLGRTAWTGAGVNAEAAIVLALRLALDAVAPDLDDLECMVNLGHTHHGVLTRLGTTTQEMRQLVQAAREQEADLGPLVASALAAHRTRVREAKHLESAEVLLEYAFFALRRLSWPVRALLAMLTRVIVVLIAWRTPRAERPDLLRPVVAISSSAPHRPGVAAMGRFGVAAPARCVWVHHSLSADDVCFVIQLGADRVGAAQKLRDTLPRALARVHAAALARCVASPASLPAVPAARRVAYGRALALHAAVRRWQRRTG